MYRSLGIGVRRSRRYQRIRLRPDEPGDALVMRLQFDRGTIVLTDPPNDLDPAEAPGVLWDARVRAHRAPASEYPALKLWLHRRGAGFQDIGTRSLLAQEL